MKSEKEESAAHLEAIGEHEHSNHRLLELLRDGLTVPERTRMQLQLPNLYCRDVGLRLLRDRHPPINHQLQVQATIGNGGLTRSRACDVEAQIGLNNQTYVLRTRCPVLDAGSSIRLEIGRVGGRELDGTLVFAPNQLVHATVIVDPPTAARPGGEVWESNEQDNLCNTVVVLAPPVDVPIEEGSLAGAPETA